MMTLEEAIKHCKDVALSCTNKECALEHFQLLKWLQEYSNMLEKQGEQESTDPDILIQQRVDALADIVAEQKPADKVEPKFHEGKWITNGDYTWKIVEVKPLDYILQSQEGNIVDDTISHVDEQFHSFTIKDAKDGDVLVHSSSMFDDFIFIYNNTSILQAYCYYSSERNRFIIEDRGHHCPWNMQEVTPATREQRDILFQKMKDAGYEWDADNKELKKIDDEKYNGKDYGIDSLYHAQRILEKTLGSVDGYQSDDGILEHKCAISAVKKLYELKYTWSEEDENRINRLIAYFEDKESFSAEDDMAYANWLKSLKDRIQSKQEWSEEDETYSGLVITA